MDGESSASSSATPQYRRFSATEVANPNPRRRSSTTLEATQKYVDGPRPPKRHNTLFEIEEQPLKGSSSKHKFAAKQKENGEWAIARYVRSQKQWVTENKGHLYDLALSAAKFIGPVVPEVAQGVGKITQAMGHDTTGAVIAAGGGLARAVVDGRRLYQNYENQEFSQTASQAAGVVGGLLSAAGNSPWPSESQQKGLEGGGLIGIGGSFAGSTSHPPTFQQPNYDLSTQINPQFDPFQSPGDMNSPHHEPGSYFPATSQAESMPSIPATMAMTTGADYSSSTATAPAVSSGFDYSSRYAPTTQGSYDSYPATTGASYSTMTSPAYSRSYTMADANMSGGNGGYGAGGYLPNESYDNRQDAVYDSASESDTAPKKKGKRR